MKKQWSNGNQGSNGSLNMSLRQDEASWNEDANENSGKETYSSGRYLDAEITVPAYETVIDFNEAYNPSCAYNDRFTCPIPPGENTLDMEVQAGEKKFR